MKKYVKILLPVVLVIFVLAFSFVYGGNSPELHKKATDKTEASQTESPDKKEASQKVDALKKKISEIEPTPTENKTAPDNREISAEKPEEKPVEKTADTEKTQNNLEVQTSQDKFLDSTERFENPQPTLNPNIPKKSESDSEITANPQATQEKTASDKAEATERKTPEKSANPTCTLLVTCSTLLSNLDSLDKAQRSLVSGDGVIFPETTVEFTEGENVFDVLCREMKNAKIHLEFSKTPAFNSVYIEGINNLYEFDCGELSGWMYSVNGTFPSFGCSSYSLADGDKIVFAYTTNLGKDLETQISEEKK